MTDLRKLVEEGLKRLKLYEKARARYHWSRWTTWRKDNAPTLLRGLSDLLLELDGLSICVDRKAADLISKDQEIHTLGKERDALKQSLIVYKDQVEGKEAALALTLHERDALKTELESIRSMATTGLDADVSVETALEVYACWKSTAMKSFDAWAEQDKTIAALKEMQGELIDTLARTLKPLWAERDDLIRRLGVSEANAIVVAGERAVLKVEAEKLKDVVRMAHRVGYQHGMGPCVCEVCRD